MITKTICSWAQSHEAHIAYHNHEWGVPVHDDAVLFEFITLEGAQAGLNWLTILQKRAGYRAAFSGWDVAAIAKYDAATVDKLVQDPKIIRHRGKIRATVDNAQVFLRIQEEYGSFDSYLWGYVDHHPVVNEHADISTVPATSPISDRLSKDLKRRGMKYVGPTIMYAYMQAVGMVNDHTVDCYRWQEVQAIGH